MEPTNQQPWLIMGDFNAVLNLDDRLGSQIQDAEVKEGTYWLILDCPCLRLLEGYIPGQILMFTAELTGPLWTFLGWLYGHICKLMQKTHTSLIMSFCVTIEEIKGKHARPFRFLNHLSHHKDFMDIALSACTGHLHGEGMEQVKANESCYETVK